MTEQSSGGSPSLPDAVQRSAPATETETAAAAATTPTASTKSPTTTTTAAAQAENSQNAGGNTTTQTAASAAPASQSQSQAGQQQQQQQQQSPPPTEPAKRPRGRPRGPSRPRAPQPQQSKNQQHQPRPQHQLQPQPQPQQQLQLQPQPQSQSQPQPQPQHQQPPPPPPHPQQYQQYQQYHQQQQQQHQHQYQHFPAQPLPPQPQPQPQQPPPPPPQYQPFYNPIPEANRRDEFYGILRELDPYRATPKEFVHLLVHAAVRDGEVAQALYHLNHDRINNPETWRPPAPPNFTSQPPPHPPDQPRPLTLIPVNQSPNAPPSASSGAGTGASPSTPAQQNADSLTSPHRRKRRRDEAGGERDTHATRYSQFGVLNPRTVMYLGPQQPPPPGSQSGQPWNPSFVPQIQLQSGATVSKPRFSLLSGPRRPKTAVAPLPIISVSPGAPVAPAAPASALVGDSSANDNAIKPIDGEPIEQSCNFTWALDRAETHLGFTGNYDKTSEIRQTSIGYEVALRLQKMLKKLSAAIDKHRTLANRVHILTVMREIIAATLEADHTVGKECRECSREFDSTYLAAVRKLTPEQLRRLKALEDGKWVKEMQDLVTEANRQAMFPLLVRALDHIKSAI
ncbi:hypothetical protein F5Y10DRAFT_264472 [Nemania abortiva]|nr:hypothetical protein F5Y10DRAFT_264472 [Nemania abortiva]